MGEAKGGEKFEGTSKLGRKKIYTWQSFFLGGGF